MAGKYVLDVFGEFAFRLISKKIQVLVSQFGFTRDQRDDLYQDFALDLCARGAKFDPEVANWEAFVLVVCENHFANILEHRMAAMRSHRREGGSLNRPIRDGEAGPRDRADLLGEACHDGRTGHRSRSGQEQYELSEDVTEAVGSLTPLQQRVCGALARGCSVSAVARSLNISRAEVSKEIAAIRSQFEQSGLRDYL